MKGEEEEGEKEEKGKERKEEVISKNVAMLFLLFLGIFCIKEVRGIRRGGTLIKRQEYYQERLP